MFILIVSLVPFLSFYCHLIAALLLLCIIYGGTHSNSLLVFLFFAVSAVKLHTAAFTHPFHFPFFFFFGLSCINLDLFYGRNNLSVL